MRHLLAALVAPVALVAPLPIAASCSSTDPRPQYYTVAQRASIRVGMRERDVLEIMGEPTFIEQRGTGSRVLVYEGDEDAQFDESFDLYHFKVVIDDGRVVNVYKQDEPTRRR